MTETHLTFFSEGARDGFGFLTFGKILQLLSESSGAFSIDCIASRAATMVALADFSTLTKDCSCTSLSIVSCAFFFCSSANLAVSGPKLS